MGLPLVTKAEYKAYAGISSNNDDAMIDLLIPKVSSLVKSLCRRSFNDWIDDPKVEYFDGGIARYTPLESPILTISSLEYSEDYGATFTAMVEYTDYVVAKADDTIRLILGDFPEVLNGFRVTYTAGYEDIPEDLKIAVLDLIKYYIKNDSAIHSNKAPGTNTVQIEYVTTTSLPAHIRRVLDLYTHSYA